MGSWVILRKQGCYRYWPGKGGRSLQRVEHLGSIRDVTMVFLGIADSSQGGRELWQVLGERPPTIQKIIELVPISYYKQK